MQPYESYAEAYQIDANGGKKTLKVSWCSRLCEWAARINMTGYYWVEQWRRLTFFQCVATKSGVLISYQRRSYTVLRPIDD